MLAWPIRWWLASLVAGVAVPLTILLTVVFVAEQRREPREARDSALRSARQLGTGLHALHNDSVRLIDTMATRPAIRNFDGQRCDSLFAVVDFFPQYLDLLLFDETGAIVCAAAPTPADAALSLEARKWIAGEVRTGALGTHAPLIRPVLDRWVSVVGVPVTGGFRGTLAIVALPEFIGHDSLPPGGVITVFDGRGTVVARTMNPDKWVGRNLRGFPLADVVLREKEGNTEARGIDGVSRQYGFTTIPDMQWSIAVGIPTESVVASARAAFLRGIIGGTLIVGVLVTIAVFMSRSIERPVRALAQAAMSVAAGAYGKVTVEGPREIATLAEAFNEMVDSRFEAERQMQDSESALKALSDRLLVVQEEERTRIAREIHDDLGQALTALKMDVLGMLEGMNAGAVVDPRMTDRVVNTLDVLVTAVQRISAELRPSILDDLGLAEAIESEARSFEHRTGIECEVSLPDGPMWRFAAGPSTAGSEDQTRAKGVAIAIYRIVQEALTNVARHSDATRVELRVRFRGDAVLLDIRDDGRGVTAQEIGSARSLGLIGIRERAAMVGGTVRFDGIAGRGTIVSVAIPLEAES